MPMSAQEFAARYNRALEDATEALRYNPRSHEPIFGVAIPQSKTIIGKMGDLRGKSIVKALVFVLSYTYLENGKQVIIKARESHWRYSAPCSEWVLATRVNSIIRRTGEVGAIPPDVTGYLFTERHLIDAPTLQKAEGWLSSAFSMMPHSGYEVRNFSPIPMTETLAA